MNTSSMDGLSRAEREALLARAKAAKLARSGGSARDGARAAERIERRGDDAAHCPASYAQQRLWLIANMGEQASAAYHVPLRFTLRGALDESALQAALDRIVQRHEALRTVFDWVDGQPVQRILARAGFELQRHDLSQAADIDAEVARWSRTEEDAPFDLAAGPLARGRLLRLGEGEHVLLLTLHHIVSDGWSMGVLMRELAELYRAYAVDGVAAQIDPLPELPVQYADYALWQREWLSGEVQLKQQAYWRERLDGAPALIELPGDRPRPPVQDYAGASLDLELDAELSEALRALSRKHGTTLYMTLLAAWAALAARLSNQDEVVIGTPVANRNRVELEPLIGFFVNTLALRLDLSGAPNAGELLARVREQVLQAQAHQDVPFEQVVEAVKPTRSLAHTPLFQLMFTWHNADEGEALEIGGLRLQAMDEGERRSAQFDLSLGLQEIDGRIVGSLGFATALFDRATVARHWEYLKALLRGMAADDAQPVARIALLDAQQRRAAVERGAAPRRAYRQGVCMQQLFEEQAQRTPDAIAVEQDGQRLSYAELNARANRLAAHLRGLGVGPDRRVALLLERSPELVVAMLATLKAGGAYVPMDPAYPPQRLDYLLADSAPKALLTQGELHAALSVGETTAVVRLDDEAAWAQAPAENPYPGALGLSAVNLAYVIYTSGSTGEPKGVMVEHANLTNLVGWHCESFPLQPGERTAAMAGVAFDACTWEIWPALSMGATLALPPQAAAGDPLQLLQWWQAQELHSGFLVTALAEIALSDASVAQPGRALRSLLTGGDRLSRVPAAPLPFELINNYGPTEATVVATSGPLRADGAAPHIGRPIANAAIYLLDAYGEPVPEGVAGEIYIGGAGVASGYFNRPELTRERFLDDPFAGRVGARMYRSGDLGRWRPDGNLEFLGRNDQQLKIRGFRIELGEIDARLARLPGVREAAVHAREDGAGDKRLVAYLVGDALAPAAQLRDALARELPEYMLPSAFVTLERLPLTPNGKLDRRALPAPQDDHFAHRAYEAPQGEIETALAQIWAELLQVERVGRRDHFFDLGGHSLLALQATARLQQRLGLNVALSLLFAHPVLEEFARAASAQRGEALPAIAAAARPPALPMSFAQQRLWFLAQMDEAASAAYHMAGGLRLRGPLDVAALQAALDRIVARHEALRTRFASHEGRPVQSIGEAAGFALAQQDLSDAEDIDAELTRWSRIEKDAPFDLAAGPLARGRLLRFGADDHALLLTLHHIVSDGWSVGVLVRELSELYRAYALDGVAVDIDPLPALPLQYADYALWQRDWLADAAQRGQLDYWRDRLAGAPALIELPTDRPRPPVQDYAGASFDLELDEDTSDALRALSRKHGTTLYMTVLAAWAALTARLAGQDEVVIGTPVANRARVEVEPLIGFFVNTLALRLDLSGQPTVSVLLARVREQVLQAQAHQDVPFEQVVEAVKPERSLAHSPLFQLMFSWQNTPQPELSLGALSLRELGPGEHRSAQFDLSLALQEVGGRIVGQLEYATALFDRATVARHVDYFKALLRGMIGDDGRAVARIGILGRDERRRVLEDRNANARPVPQAGGIHRLFEQQAARTPDAIALEQAGQGLSYAELNARANRLARHLRALGVGRDQRVAIALPRSAELIVAILATLKAGGAYVPLDPAYPAERLSYLLGDSAPKVVLTQRELRAGLPAAAATLVEIDADAAAWAALPAADLDGADLDETADDASALAYVIYTSGSTGQPKGVMVEHAGLINQIAALQAHYALSAADRVLQFVSPTFDVSVEEIFTALLSGATLVLRTDEWIAGPARWCELCAQHALTVANLPTLFWQQLAQAADVAIPPALRQIVIGGDAVSPAALAAWWSRGGHRPALSNAYGPTETTINASVADCAPQANPHSVGRPLANTAIYLLDAHGGPVPEGSPGEIYIGGAGVARGYLNRPELSAERFLADPFAAREGARMYRSGDLGRWLPDGTVEFLGRNDHQLKIRGFRVEPGEIEALLRRLPGIAEAVVHAREDRPGDKRLVAYLVGAEIAPVAELRAALSRELPEYMLPSAFVALERLPLTPSGKLDRLALPAPDADAYAQRNFEAPQGATEIALAQIWAELLQLEQVGRNDHFFESGGHSLLAVQLMERLRGRGLYADIRTLFAQPTLAGLARAVEQSRQRETREVAVPPNLIPAGATALTPDLLPLVRLDEAQLARIVDSVPGGAANIQDIYPLAPLQEGILFHHLLQAQGDPYLLSTTLAFDSRERLDGFARALQTAIDRHDVLRTAVLWEGLDEPVQVVWRNAALEVETLVFDGPDIAAQLRAYTDPSQYRIDVRSAPQMRGFAAFDAAGQRWLLVLLQHHLIMDHVTSDLLMQELTLIQDGRESELPEPVPFRDFVARARLGVSVAEHEDYFRRILGDVEETTAPFGLKDVQNAGQDIREAQRLLDPALSQRIREQAKALGVSAASVFHWAWGQVLAKATGRDEAVFGTVLFGRMHGGARADRAMGLFINTLPVRVRLGEVGVREGVLAAHASLSELVWHEHAPLALAQRCSALPASTPLFSALLNYRHSSL